MNLRQLYQQKESKKNLEEKLSSLHLQKKELELRLKKLYDTLLKEEKDVERLEKGGLSTKLFNLTGKLDQKKEKEESEAHQAKANYQTASYQLEVLKQDIERYESQLHSLKYCEKHYQTRFDLLYNYALEQSIPSHEVEQYSTYMKEFSVIEETMNHIKESRSIVSLLRKKLKELDSRNVEDMIGNGIAPIEYEIKISKSDALDEIKNLCISLKSHLEILGGNHQAFGLTIKDDFLDNDFLEMPFSSFSTMKLVGKILDPLLDVAIELKKAHDLLLEPYENGIIKKEKLYQELENFLIDYDENHPGILQEEKLDEKQLQVMKMKLQEGHTYLNLLKDLFDIVETAKKEAGEDIYRNRSWVKNNSKFDTFSKMNDKMDEVKQKMNDYREILSGLSIDIPFLKMDLTRKLQDYVLDLNVADYRVFKDIKEYSYELKKCMTTLELELTQLDEKIYH